jgi:hypothetical protein
MRHGLSPAPTDFEHNSTSVMIKLKNIRFMYVSACEISASLMVYPDRSVFLEM